MSYPEMCFAAEKAGAIDKTIRTVMVFSGSPKPKNWKGFNNLYYYGSLESGVAARAWTEAELAGMLDRQSEFFYGYSDGSDVKMWTPITAGDIESPPHFATLQESLLWTVMYHRGFLWNADKKEFERRGK